jgi:DNA-binding PadR family transcriptional regulator
MTNTELAILGLLIEQPRHGYEIEQVINERGMRDWTDVGFSSIYYVLGRLERAGLVAASADAGHVGGPARKVYAPTRAGQIAWTDASLAVLSVPAAGNRPFLLGLAAVAGLPADRSAEAVHAYRDALDARLAELTERHAAIGEAPWYVESLFDYSFRMIRSERAWVASFVRTLDRQSAGEVIPMQPSLKMKPFVPQLVELPARTMAVVRTVGDPGVVGPRVFPALYGAVYPLKFARKKQGADFRVEAPCARWFSGPDWRSVPRDEWTAAWALPVPADTAELAQKDPETPVKVEKWDYGTVAQVLHVGTYAEEEPTIVALHAYIEEKGFEIAGPHEEEYMSRPGSKVQKTIVRYQVRPKG